MPNASIHSRIATGLAACAMLTLAIAAQAQTTPERGVFVTQIGDGSRAIISQQNSDSFARVIQDGNDNQVDLTQKGNAAHRAEIAQQGDGNLVVAEQDGDGVANLALVQEGNGNIALLLQRETSATDQSSAAIVQQGNNNTVSLIQNGSDNSATLSQLGSDNEMTAIQQGSGNRLEWTQNGDGLADLGIIQEGGSNLQVTQGTTGVQFAPPPSNTGG